MSMTETVEEPKQSRNKILDLEMELRLYLEAKMREPLSNKEIKILFDKSFPWKSGQISTLEIGAYRRKYVPEYKQVLIEKYGKDAQRVPEEIEDEILEEVREAEKESEEFSLDEKRKINQLKAHRKVLKELWDQYNQVRSTKEQTAKARFLELMSKELGEIAKLEQTERSFLSSMDDIRKAELKMSVEQHLDSLQTWFLPRMISKCKDKSQALETLFRLELFMNDYGRIIMDSETLEKSNQELLNKIYSVKKVKGDEKEDV